MVLFFSFLRTWYFKNQVDKQQSNRQKNKTVINLSRWWLKSPVEFTHLFNKIDYYRHLLEGYSNKPNRKHGSDLMESMFSMGAMWFNGVGKAG